MIAEFIANNKDDLKKIMHIIGRLCIRQLRNFQKDLSETNLFIFLAEDKNF